MLQWLGSVGSVGRLGKSFTFHRMQKENSQWRFSSRKVLDLESGVVVSSKVVHCHRHGMPTPFLLRLLVEHHPRSDTKMFELLRYTAVDGGCFMKHSQFEFTELQLPNEINFCILNGPNVMWSKGTNIYLACTGAQGLNHMTLRSLNVQENVKPKMKIEKFWAFDWNQNEHEDNAAILLFIRVQSCSAGEENRGPMETGMSQNWLLLLLTMQETDLKIEHLPDSSLIPRDYGCIATCIAQHCIYVTVCGDIVSKCQFFVGTLYQQVVIFNEGAILHCVSLQHVPQMVISMETMDDEIAIAVQCSAGEAYAFKITDSGPLQECASWQGVSDLLAGDFAGIGHDQLLVMFSGDGKLFCVTDLVQFTADSESEQVCSGTAAQSCATESLVSAVRALQIRKQTGEAYLTDMRRELQQKSQLLESSVSIMKSLEGSDGTTPVLPKPDPALICLLPGNIDVNVQTTNCTVASRHRPSRGLKLLHSWQRVVDGLWIIGIVGQNQTQNLLCDMGFSLINGSSRLPQERSSSRILWTEDDPEESKQDGPPAPKKQKCADYVPTLAMNCKGGVVLPGRKFCCVLKTTLPVLASHTLEVSLVSSWRTLRTGHEDPPGPNNGGHSGCELARLGTITLAVKDFASCNLSCSVNCLSLWNGEETWPEKECGMECKDQQDLACLLAARSFIKLEAHSTFTNLLRLPAMLKVRLPLPDCAVYTADAGLPHVGSGTESCAESASGALEGVTLHITPHVNSARVGILYKATPQLVLLMEIMHSALPEDVLLSASPGSSSQMELLAACLRCVRQELNSKSEVVEQRLRRLKGGGDEHAENDGSGGGSHTRLESQTNIAVTTLMHKFS